MKDVRLEITTIDSDIKDKYKLLCMTYKTDMTEDLTTYIKKSIKIEKTSTPATLIVKEKTDNTRLEITKINESLKDDYKLLCMKNKTTMKDDLTSFILLKLLNSNQIKENQIKTSVKEK